MAKVGWDVAQEFSRFGDAVGGGALRSVNEGILEDALEAGFFFDDGLEAADRLGQLLTLVDFETETFNDHRPWLVGKAELPIMVAVHPMGDAVDF